MNNEEIKSQIDTTLDELGWKELDPEKKAEIKKQILDSFDKVILEAVLISINEEQANELREILEGDEKDIGGLVTHFSSEIPSLADNIDIAVTAEWENWKKILDRRPKKEEA